VPNLEENPPENAEPVPSLEGSDEYAIKGLGEAALGSKRCVCYRMPGKKV
jgi:hypothetical protein